MLRTFSEVRRHAHGGLVALQCEGAVGCGADDHCAAACWADAGGDEHVGQRLEAWEEGFRGVLLLVFLGGGEESSEFEVVGREDVDSPFYLPRNAALFSGVQLWERAFPDNQGRWQVLVRFFPESKEDGNL